MSHYERYFKERESIQINNRIEMDELAYQHALAFVLDVKMVSISKIQRALRVGYNHASHIIERMDHEGLVSKPNHNGSRSLLNLKNR